MICSSNSRNESAGPSTECCRTASVVLPRFHHSARHTSRRAERQRRALARSTLTQGRPSACTFQPEDVPEGLAVHAALDQPRPSPQDPSSPHMILCKVTHQCAAFDVTGHARLSSPAAYRHDRAIGPQPRPRDPVDAHGNRPSRLAERPGCGRADRSESRAPRPCGPRRLEAGEKRTSGASATLSGRAGACAGVACPARPRRPAPGDGRVSEPCRRGVGRQSGVSFDQIGDAPLATPSSWQYRPVRKSSCYPFLPSPS